MKKVVLFFVALAALAVVALVALVLKGIKSLVEGYLGWAQEREMRRRW